MLEGAHTVDLEQLRPEPQAHFEEQETPRAEQSSAHARGSRASEIPSTGVAMPITARVERIVRREIFMARKFLGAIVSDEVKVLDSLRDMAICSRPLYSSRVATRYYSRVKRALFDSTLRQPQLTLGLNRSARNSSPLELRPVKVLPFRIIGS